MLQIFLQRLMRPIKLHEHLNKMHPEHREKPLEHFKRLRDKTSKTQEKSLDSMFKANTSMQERGLQVGYELSFLLAQECPTPHRRRGCAEACPGDLPQNDAEQKKQTAAQELPAVPLSNNTVRRCIDNISDDLEVQLVTILRTTNFFLALDESTVRDSEALLLAYARFHITTNLLRRCCFVNLSKPPQLRWAFSLWSRTILVKRTFRFQTLCLPQQMALPQ